MFTVITDNLHKTPKTISTTRAVEIISNEDVFISADYHFLRWTNKLHEPGLCKKLKIKDKKILEMHNDCVKSNDWFLFLGDISEEELRNSEDIATLYNYCHSMHGKKIMIRGNNDNFDDEFYNKCGFCYVSYMISCPVRNIVFTHDAIDLKEYKFESNWINIHGHFHGCMNYYNIDWHKHIDTYFGYHKDKVLRLSQYLKLYKQGYYKGRTLYEPYPFLFPPAPPVAG